MYIVPGEMCTMYIIYYFFKILTPSADTHLGIKSGAYLIDDQLLERL